MKEINLREYYPFYNMDVYLEVSDEIAGQLDRFKLDEEAQRVRVLRAKAYFSLDRGDGIEKDALQKPPQPLELILKAEQAAHLDAALRALSDCQRRRLLAFYLDGKSKSQIAREEGVRENSVRESIIIIIAALRRRSKICAKRLCRFCSRDAGQLDLHAEALIFDANHRCSQS